MVAIVSSPVQDIPVADIHPSPLNPRTHFDPAKIEALATNLKKTGQIEAITVRPSATQKGKYELVNGERRWRAAQVAQLPTLAAKVCEMNDADALEVMLSTGAEGHVEPLTPLEEAAGYQNAMRIMGLTLQAVAVRFSKTVTYIQERVSLMELPEAAREALEKEELPQTIAFKIARIPSVEKRKEATEAILHSEVHGGVMPNRAAKLYIEKQICRSLQGAPFDTADAALKPDIGACTTCQYRAGNNKEAYGDVKNPHTCMNPGCFEAKVAAARARVLAREAKDGKEPLPAEVNDLVFPKGERDLSWKSDYVAYTKPITRDLVKSEVSRPPTWASLCEGRGVKVYVGIDQEGRAVDVAKLSEALAAVPEDEVAIFSDDIVRRHALAKPKGRVSAVAPTASIAEEEKLEQELRDKAARAAKKRSKKSREWLDDLVTKIECNAAAGKLAWNTYAYWSLMAELMLRALGDEDVVFICDLYGLDYAIPGHPEQNAPGISPRQAVIDLVAKLSRERCAALVTALTIAPWLRAEGPEAPFVTAWHDEFLKEKAEEESESEERETAEDGESGRQGDGETAEPPAFEVFEFDRDGRCKNPDRIEIPCPKGYQCALLVAQQTDGTWTYGAIWAGGDGHVFKYEPHEIANGEATREDAIEAAAMVACNEETDEIPILRAVQAWQAKQRTSSGLTRLEELTRQIVEKFTAAKITKATQQNRVIRTATSGRVTSMNGLGAIEDCERVLAMLANAGKAAKPAGE